MAIQYPNKTIEKLLNLPSVKPPKTPEEVRERIRNREGKEARKRRLEYKRRYNQEHKEENKKYRWENKDKFKRHRKRYLEKHRKSTKDKLRHSISSGIHKSLKENKAGRHWEDLVGYTLQDLIERLEVNFKKGMTWENYGEWHIDHKKPVSAFNFETPDDPEFKTCWSLGNLQPLWAEDNWRKNNRKGSVL